MPKPSLTASAHGDGCAPLPRTHTLREAGFKVTRQRQDILQILDASVRPLSVEEIRQRMASDRSGIPTVYRNLDQFEKEGLLESVLGRDQVRRFIRCHTHKHHHHMQCEGCGRMIEVDACCLADALTRMGGLGGFRVTRHELHLFGLCPECQVGLSHQDRSSVARSREK